jgi:hypothetical protein
MWVTLFEKLNLRDRLGPATVRGVIFYSLGISPPFTPLIYRGSVRDALRGQFFCFLWEYISGRSTETRWLNGNEMDACLAKKK